MRRLAGLTWDDVRDVRGDFDLGTNATGVINSSIHFTGDEIITVDSMPAAYVQDIMDSVARFQAEAKRRRPGGHIKAQLPLPIWKGWRRQWEQGPRKWGVIWRAFLTSKIEDRDYSKFLITK